MAVPGVNTNFDVAMAKQAFSKAASAECPFKKLLKDAMQGAIDSQKARFTSAAATSGATGETPSTAASGTTAQGSAGPVDSQKLQGKLNEMISVGLIAPMLADALGKFEQTYFANSPAEQAYTKQLTMEIATKVGQSSKLPLAKYVAQAMQKRMENS